MPVLPAAHSIVASPSVQEALGVPAPAHTSVSDSAGDARTAQHSSYQALPSLVYSADAKETFDIGNTSWNTQYQDALDMPCRTEEERQAQFHALSKLTNDFVALATHYGRTIITELSLPTNKRTIPHKNRIGGVMGGRKFIVNGILFKLAIDPKVRGGHMFGGRTPDSEAAAKAAGNELRSAIHCFSAVQSQSGQSRKFDLRVPMQAIVDSHGWRLVAMPGECIPPCMLFCQ